MILCGEIVRGFYREVFVIVCGWFKVELCCVMTWCVLIGRLKEKINFWSLIFDVIHVYSWNTKVMQIHNNNSSLFDLSNTRFVYSLP